MRQLRFFLSLVILVHIYPVLTVHRMDAVLRHWPLVPITTLCGGYCGYLHLQLGKQAARGERFVQGLTAGRSKLVLWSQGPRSYHRTFPSASHWGLRSRISLTQPLFTWRMRVTFASGSLWPVFSFKSHIIFLRCVLVLTPFDRWRNGDSERSDKLPKINQPMCGKARIQTHASVTSKPWL